MPALWSHPTLFVFSVLVAVVAAAPAFAAESTAEHANADKRGLALEGYDPVAYFPEGGGEPQKGSEDFIATHDGLTYRFADQRNREAFLENPEKYVPAYGGWCAYAMGKAGRKVEVDPEAFLIEDGELLLFFKSFLNDTRKPWRDDRDALKPAADRHWQRILED